MYVVLRKGGSKMKTLTKKEKRAVILGIIESASVELKSCLEMADGYIENNLTIDEVAYLGIIIDKMSEHVDKLYKLFINNDFAVFEV